MQSQVGNPWIGSWVPRNPFGAIIVAILFSRTVGNWRLQSTRRIDDCLFYADQEQVVVARSLPRIGGIEHKRCLTVELAVNQAKHTNECG